MLHVNNKFSGKYNQRKSEEIENSDIFERDDKAFFSTDDRKGTKKGSGPKEPSTVTIAIDIDESSQSS